MAADRGEVDAVRPARGSGDRRLGEVAAQALTRDIAASGWVQGSVLGSEAELMERYDVSRSVLREAVRVLEHLGVARMRRGPGGGLVVASPAASAVSDAVLVYLTSTRVPLEDVVDARNAIEVASARLAALRHSDAALDEVRSRAADFGEDGTDGRAEVRFHLAIARMTDNPALELFVEILGRVTAQYEVGRLSARKQAAGEAAAAHAHHRIIAAIESGDGELAAKRMGTHVRAIRDFYSSRQLERRLGLSDAMGTDGGGRLAPAVAKAILSEVVARGWPAGVLLGSENELLERHGVSRSVLREALRLLEFNGVVGVRRGPGGGVFVTMPSKDATVGAMTAYIESRRVTPRQLFEVRHAVELAALALTVERADARACEVLTQIVRSEAHFSGEPERHHEFHHAIAELSGNGVLSLFLYALTHLTVLHTLSAAEVIAQVDDVPSAIVSHVHGHIVDAIAAGDLAAARRRMERHLSALVAHQR